MSDFDYTYNNSPVSKNAVNESDQSFFYNSMNLSYDNYEDTFTIRKPNLKYFSRMKFKKEYFGNEKMNPIYVDRFSQSVFNLGGDLPFYCLSKENVHSSNFCSISTFKSNIDLINNTILKRTFKSTSK